MQKSAGAKQVAIDILGRSICQVQVGAAIEDHKGRIMSWGWNFDGLDGYGMCAEAHAILRANKSRLYGSTIYIAGLRQRNGNLVETKPCEKCQALIDKWRLKPIWRKKDGSWNV